MTNQFSTGLHPGTTTLRLFNSSNLDDTQHRTSVSSHIDSCDDCAAKLSLFDTSLPFIEIDPYNSRQLKSLKHLDQYTIEARLGSGGSSEVFLARHRHLSHSVALKVYRADNEHAVRRHELESRALAALRHPNIAAIYEAGIVDNRPYIAMEYVPGIPITEYCERNNLGVNDKLILFCEVCEAVSYIHRHAILHRDLKPSNIIVSNDTHKVKIIDFGIAKSTSVTRSTVTAHGEIVGTAAYISPEALRGETHSPASDVFSLGVILYQLLTGHIPFTGGSFDDVLRCVLYSDPVRPSQIAPRLPKDIDYIVLKSLAKDPHCRYLAAGELANDIQRFLTGSPIAARPQSHIYLLRKLFRRHRHQVCIMLLLFFVILFSCMFSLHAYRQELTARRGLEQIVKLCLILHNDETWTNILQQQYVASDDALNHTRFLVQEALERFDSECVLEILVRTESLEQATLELKCLLDEDAARQRQKETQ